MGCAGGVVLPGLFAPFAGNAVSFLFVLMLAMLACWRAGLWPGIVVAAAGAIAATMVFLPETDAKFGARTLAELAAYACAAVACLGVVEAWRRSRQRAEQAASLAEQRSAELRQFHQEFGDVDLQLTRQTAANEALRKTVDELRIAQDELQQQIQELIRSRRAHEAENARYEELFDSAPVGYIISNPEGVIQQVNRAAASLLGELSHFLTGYPLARLIAKADRLAFFANLERLARQELESIDNWEVRIRPHHRNSFPCLVQVNAVRQEDGSGVTGLRWVLRDITERKQVEERIRRLNTELEQRVRERTGQYEAANRELEAFSYSVSHDLRAPLRSINGFCKAVLEEYRDKLDERGAGYLEYAHNASVRMSQLIDDLMNLSRITRSELHRQRVDLAACAAQIAQELQARDPQRAVCVTIAPRLITRGDEGLLRIALENLISNAWKFTARVPQATIEIGATRRDGERVFFVRDNGAGFSMENAHRLFGVFQRLHSANEFPGTGIGLVTVRRIIDRHGGVIWAESDVDHGATFYFTLPKSTSDVESARVPFADRMEPRRIPEATVAP